ncbi:OB-fold domain-containing protein [Dactylosporangium fulvum]|uniref:MaoC family dehydratase N-terminal domain-containing protein n=1 Tax=Dactylosporangium fulvum TaxID=53359 RepID=A0ABY5W712_9ACTN|nr:MaoC family dehydratase N-terminal domain-containing protein [Dactylosporangium fulvum]UWP85317.1 MaoC family dehydratase N-terminal domain-containing protein [Dactylosporangium fulvum]
MTTTTTATGEDALFQALRAFVGQEATPVRHAQDPVNRPMIRHFVEAMDDENPVYLDPEAAAATGRDGIVAPPAMLSTWLMVGYRAHRAARSGPPADTAMARMLAILDEAGFTGVVATNDEQTYHRELREGDQLSMRTVIVEISPRKQTGLGPGYFITTARTYFDQHEEVVAEQRFRILRFSPAASRPVAEPSPADPSPADPAQRPKPLVTRDNEFWFAAARQRRLVIQACDACGRLRHPPSPACPHCRSFDWHEVTASGRGSVHSFVVGHHPKAPGFDYPLTVVLVDLEEGTRLVADFAGEPAEVHIGMPVEIDWLAYDDELTLPRVRARREEV